MTMYFVMDLEAIKYPKEVDPIIREIFITHYRLTDVSSRSIWDKRYARVAHDDDGTPLKHSMHLIHWQKESPDNDISDGIDLDIVAPQAQARPASSPLRAKTPERGIIHRIFEDVYAPVDDIRYGSEDWLQKGDVFDLNYIYSSD